MYRWAEHTGELELHVEGTSCEALFHEALAAFGELVREDGEGEPAWHEISLEAADAGTLFADWLDELVYLADTDGFVADRAQALELSGARLTATLEGLRQRPTPLVKAVTYHGLELKRQGDVWRARVVLDV